MERIYIKINIQLEMYQIINSSLYKKSQIFLENWLTLLRIREYLIRNKKYLVKPKQIFLNKSISMINQLEMNKHLEYNLNYKRFKKLCKEMQKFFKAKLEIYYFQLDENNKIGLFTSFKLNIDLFRRFILSLKEKSYLGNQLFYFPN
jgi:ribosomal protein S6